MASPQELFNLYAGFDPYGAYRQGQMQETKYDIEQMSLEEQKRQLQQDIEESKKAPGLGQMAGGAQQPGGIAGMAKSILPQGTVLQKQDGTSTFAGTVNDSLFQSSTLLGNATKKIAQRFAFKVAAGQSSIHDLPFER